MDPLSELGARFNLEGYTFGQASTIAPLELDPASAPRGPLGRLASPTEDATQLGSALIDAARHAKGRSLDGVVVITDGGCNRGEDPMLAAKAVGVPLYTVGVGLPEDKDLEIPFLFCEGLVFKNDRFPITVRIRQRGFSGRTTTLVIKRIDTDKNEEVVKEERITLSDELERMHTVDVIPDREGVFTYVAELEPFPDQAPSDNTRRAKTGIRVIDKKIRVLYVEDSPRYEFRFLRSILEADRQRISPTFILNRGESLGHGSALLRRFPDTLAQLKAFDVVILGDVAADFFTSQELKVLEEFVRTDGGGLIAIAGDTNMPSGYLGTPLAGMLPVEVDPLPPPAAVDDLHHTIATSFRAEVTPDGARWPALRLSADAEENERDWDRAEPMEWFYPSRAVKPGASVLLAHPEHTMPDGAKMPILVSERYGKGQVLYFASDEAWRWRFLPGTAQHRRLWGQIVADISLEHLLGASDHVQIDTDRSEYALGDHVQIIARLSDTDYNPLSSDAVDAVVEHALSKSTVVLAARADQPGVFTGEWVPAELGSSRIAVESGGESAERTVTVSAPHLEFEDTGQHTELLRRMAQASGGAYLPLERIKDLTRILDAAKTTTNERPSELGLWNAPGVLVGLGLLLGIEWFLRKRSDLL